MQSMHFYASASLRTKALCSQVVRPSVRLSLRPDYIFFKWEGKAGRGDGTGQLKKFRQGGHMGGLNKYLFLVYFFYLTQ